MRDYSLTHVRDEVLLRDLAALVREERGTVASFLAHLAEVDARKLYVPLGYSSLFSYCMEELRLSEDTTCKRIQAARAARRFPILFTELAEGRLHLTAVCLLAPHLSPENAEELVRAATHRRKSEIEELLACCVSTGSGNQTVLAPDGVPAPEQVDRSGSGSLLSQVKPLVPLMVQPEVRDQVRYLQALLSHALPSGDVSKILRRALDLLTEEVEKRRFGTGNGPVRRRRTGNRNRYIPAHVRHAVWDRDGGRCTFIGTNGHRCNSEKYIEFDHVEPRNREDTVEGLRLRCDAHNQHEAERIFGTEFMARKREEARLAAERKREEARLVAEKKREEARIAAEKRHAEAEARAKASAENAELEEQIQDVLSALRRLGIKGDQARRAAERARALQVGSLEDRIRAALQFHGECVTRNPRAARLLSASG